MQVCGGCEGGGGREERVRGCRCEGCKRGGMWIETGSKGCRSEGM